eukprot:gene10444-2575_t
MEQRQQFLQPLLHNGFIPQPTQYNPPIPGLPLPAGWRQQVTPDGKVYYYNTQTRESSYTHPAALLQNQQQNQQPSETNSIQPSEAQKPKETRCSEYNLPPELKNETIPILQEVAASEPHESKRVKSELHDEKSQGPGASENMKRSAQISTFNDVPSLPMQQQPHQSHPSQFPSQIQHHPLPVRPPPLEHIPPRLAYPPHSALFNPPTPSMHHQISQPPNLNQTYDHHQPYRHSLPPHHHQQNQYQQSNLNVIQRKAIPPAGPSLNEKQAKFRELLEEQNVSAFAMWESVWPSLKDEPAFKALTSKQAQSAFKKQARESFRQLLIDAAVSIHTTWGSFKTRWQQDKRFKGLAKEIDRENLFRNFIEELQDNDRATSKQMEQQKEAVFACFDDLQVTHRDSFKRLKSRITSDKRCKDTSSRELETLFREYCQKYGRGGRSAMMQRKAEVNMERHEYRRDLAKASSSLQRGEGHDAFQTLLASRIRSHQLSWEEGKAILQSDPLWKSCTLPDVIKFRLFEEHQVKLSLRVRQRYHEAIDEALDSIGGDSDFEKVYSLIQEDARTKAFSENNEDLTKEFEKYKEERNAHLIEGFKELLREIKCITHKSWSKVSEYANMVDSPHMKEVQEYLEQDKRYHILEHNPTIRAALLVDYMRELERKGTPPPPTASNPEKDRRKKPNITAM